MTATAFTSYIPVPHQTQNEIVKDGEFIGFHREPKSSKPWIAPGPANIGAAAGAIRNRPKDRRVRVVALTPRGKHLIVSAFRKHSGQMKRVFSELSSAELHSLELALKKIGKRAAALMKPSR